MNVRELREMLKQYPDDMEIVNSRYSDYEIVYPDDWSVISGVLNSRWVMRSHPTMSDENKRKEKKYLFLEGN